MGSMIARYRPVHRSGIRAAWILVGMSAGFAAHAAPTADEQNTMALWKEQRIDFYYRSSTAIYACSALQARIVTILYAVGARADLGVAARGFDPMLSPPAKTMPSIPGRDSRTD